jgi:hypothetical protein
MWLIAESPVTVRTVHGDVRLAPGIPHELPDAVGDRVLQCAGDRVRVHAQEPAPDPLIEPAAPNARPVYWERADTSIVGPGQPEFLAMVGSGQAATYWVVAQFDGLPIWINSMQLRSKRQFEEQVRPVVVTLVKGIDDHMPRKRATVR